MPASRNTPPNTAAEQQSMVENEVRNRITGDIEVGFPKLSVRSTIQLLNAKLPKYTAFFFFFFC